MLAGLITPKVSNLGGLSSLLLGMGVGLTGFLLGQLFEPLAFLNDNRYMIPCTVGSSLFGLAVGTFLAPFSAQEKEHIQRFFESMETGQSSVEMAPEISGEIAEAAVSPLPVIGFSISVLGAVLFLMILLTESIEAGWVSMVVGIGMMVLGLAFLLVRRGRKAKDS
jgi:hypothetical protein